MANHNIHEIDWHKPIHDSDCFLDDINNTGNDDNNNQVRRLFDARIGMQVTASQIVLRNKQTM
jgi:hypothetical protein